MMPKSAVADSATITRLCARLPLRSLISLSVLRHHGGLRRDHDPVSRGIADHWDPGLEEERDLDSDRAAARRPDARAVPDEARVRHGWHGRAASSRRNPRAGGVDLKRKATSEFALNGGNDRGIRGERRIEGNGRPRALARGVRD